MATPTKTPTLTADGQTVKVSMVAMYALLQMTHPKTLEDKAVIKLIVASKGGFSGEDAFITIEGTKVARSCAMTGAFFAHDNTDKTASFFYKNGSYVIGAEVLKANARKLWDKENQVKELELELQMLNEEISPKEWKVQSKALKDLTFPYEMADSDKARIITDFDGYKTEEAFTEAYKADTVPAFDQYADIIAEYREEEAEALEALDEKIEALEEEAENAE